MGSIYTKFRTALKNNRRTRRVFEAGKKIHDTRLRKNAFLYHGTFINRSKGSKTLCIILAGYKEFLYTPVFGRLERYMEDDIDVCIVTSGKWSGIIADLCKRKEWSYLSTKENNVSLVQNVAINLHPNAKYIFKLDEDIFITKGFFKKMMVAYDHAQSGPYNVGVLAPLIPINGYGNYRVLEMAGLLDDYKDNFEKPRYESGPHRLIENSPQTAAYMWENIDIDLLNEKAGMLPVGERPCAIRFSIGAILFERSLWKDMKYFPVDRHTNAMGADEAWINTFCNRESICHAS